MRKVSSKTGGHAGMAYRQKLLQQGVFCGVCLKTLIALMRWERRGISTFSFISVEDTPFEVHVRCVWFWFHMGLEGTWDGMGLEWDGCA
jgi:hypothetical protein